jgi:tetratricopeptide (TPR) repeat protein
MAMIKLNGGALKGSCRIFFLTLICIFMGARGYDAFGQTPAEDTVQINKWMKEFNDTYVVNPQYALIVSQKVIDLSEKIKYPKGIAKGYFASGGLYDRMKNTVKAAEYLQKALAASREYHFPKVEWRTLGTLGTMHAEQSDRDAAFAYFTEALAICKTINDSGGMAICYLFIGNNFSETGNYEAAIQSYDKSLAMYKALHMSRDLGHLYVNIADLYYRERKYTEALQTTRASVNIYYQLADTANLSFSFDLLGEIFIGLSKYDSALYYCTQSASIAARYNDQRGEASALTSLGIISDSMGKYKEAERYYKQALHFANGSSYKGQYHIIKQGLAAVYAKMHDYKSAYEYLDTAFVNKDSLVNEDKAKATAEMQVRFDVKELDDKNKLLQKENDVKQLRLQRKNVLIYAGFGAAVLFLVIGWQMVRQNRLKANQQKLELEQKQLLAQINPHFIFNCLNSIQQFVVQNDIINANKYLADFALLMRQTLDNSKDGVISIQREIEYLENYLSFEHMRFEDKFTYNILCAADISKVTTEIPSMIIQPFVENAIRHGLCNLETRKGVLNIRFYKRDGFLYCEVDDNGIGMEKAQKLKDQTFIKYQSHGMELTQQRLALVSRMNSTDYNINIINKKGTDQEPQGTTITIKFPLQA